MPTTCNYYVTLRCNQRCTFCNIPHTNDGSPSREPTMDQVRANLRDLKRLGVMVLDVTGGEPLLYRHLIEMLALAKSMRFMTTVTTNGMLYPKFAEQLAGKVDALLFSIDSTDPHEHDRIRAMKSFHLSLEALAVARELRQPLYISHVVTNESFGKVDEMIRFARDQAAILYLNPCFSFFGNEGLDPEKAKELFKYFGRPGVIIVQIGNDPVCSRPSRDPVFESLFFVLRQRGPRSGEGKGTVQIFRSTGRHHRSCATSAHFGRRQSSRRSGVPGSDLDGGHLSRKQAASALLPLQGRGDSDREQAL